MNTKIAELERQLELKKAFLSARVSFGKGNKFSEETKKQVTDFVQALCVKAAETNEPDATPTFSEQEVTVLKQMVAKIVAKAADTQPTPVNTVPQPTVVTLPHKVAPAPKNMAQIMLLDNVDVAVRNKVSSESVVKVIGKVNEATAFVETGDGFRFHIPIEDLDFDYQRSEK